MRLSSTFQNKKLFTWTTVVLLCFAGVVLRIYLGWWLGHLGDIQAYQLWALDPGEPIVSTVSFQPLPDNYPPIYPSILRLLRWTHRGLNLPGDFRVPVQQAPDIELCRPIILLLKTPAMIADTISAVLI